MADREHHTGRTVALVGGAALVAWLLLRGKGWGLGGGGGRGLGDAANRAASGDATTTPAQPCRVWIRSRGLELDGAPAELATVVARCREHGRAEVQATGAAITGTIVAVLRALKDAGIAIDVPPDLIRLASEEVRR